MLVSSKDNLSPRQGDVGFTIIEVMIVVVIMGILSGFAVNSFYQQAFRGSVQGEGKKILQFLNMANMHVKKTGEAASIQIDSTGLYLKDSEDCSGTSLRSNEFDDGVVLSSLGSAGNTGLPSGLTSDSTGYLGVWTGCTTLEKKLGNSIQGTGGVIIGNSRLPSDEKYIISIIKSANDLNFRTFVSIAGSNWEERK